VLAGFDAGATASGIGPGAGPGLAALPGVSLSARNHAHAARVEADAARLADSCRTLLRRHPDRDALFERERLVILLSRLVNELLTMSLVLVRASALSRQGRPDGQDLADVYCTAAGHRLDGCWRELAAGIEQPGGPDHAGLTDRWLRGTGLDLLAGDAEPPGPAQPTGERQAEPAR
jgi:hypothetical protein